MTDPDIDISSDLNVMVLVMFCSGFYVVGRHLDSSYVFRLLGHLYGFSYYFSCPKFVVCYHIDTIEIHSLTSCSHVLSQ